MDTGRGYRAWRRRRPAAILPSFRVVDRRGNRAVHFAGGHLHASLDDLDDEYSVSLWFWNGLPADVRQVTGTLFARGDSSEQEALIIGGNAEPEAADAQGF